MTYGLHKLNIFLLLLDHGLEVDIDFDTEGLIRRLSLAPHLFDIVHAFATLLSINLQLFYLVQAGGLFRKWSRISSWGNAICGASPSIAIGLVVIIAVRLDA